MNFKKGLTNCCLDLLLPFSKSPVSCRLLLLFLALLIGDFLNAQETASQYKYDYEFSLKRNEGIGIKNKKTKIYKLIKPLAKDLKAWYEILHRNPEIGYQEKKTASFLTKLLEMMGWRVIKNVGNSNSLIAEWGGTNAGNTILIRVNMDALPYTDRSPLERRVDNYSAPVKYNFGGRLFSLMHGAGNDAHMSIALGLAKLLAENKKPFAGKIILAFQSGEYSTSLGKAHGSDVLLSSDYFLDNKPDIALGFQYDPSIEVGKISFSSDVALPMATVMNINIYPKEERTIDFVDNTNLLYGAFSQIMVPFQRIVYEERFLKKNPVRVDFHAINGAPFVDVPAQDIEATAVILTQNNASLCRLQDKLAAALFASGESMGVSVVPSFFSYAPRLTNNLAIANSLQDLVQVSTELSYLESPLYFSSFGKYAQASKVGGFFFFIGAGKNTNANEASHFAIPSDKFYIEEESLVEGLVSLYQVTELAQKGFVIPLN